MKLEQKRSIFELACGALGGLISSKFVMSSDLKSEYIIIGSLLGAVIGKAVSPMWYPDPPPGTLPTLPEGAFPYLRF